MRIKTTFLHSGMSLMCWKKTNKFLLDPEPRYSIFSLSSRFEKLNYFHGFEKSDSHINWKEPFATHQFNKTICPMPYGIYLLFSVISPRIVITLTIHCMQFCLGGGIKDRAVPFLDLEVRSQLPKNIVLLVHMLP